MKLTQLFSRLVDLTDKPGPLDLFDPTPPPLGLLSYSATACQLVPGEHAAWRAALDDEIERAEDPRGGWRPEETAARIRAAALALDAALATHPRLPATLREGVITRCGISGADPRPALDLVTDAWKDKT